MKLQQRLVRYEDLKPCTSAFIDTRSPGSNQKENFTIIGPGVSENPEQHVHISVAHGFNIGGARQPPGCLNSQHSHLTAEVFVVHTGVWAFRTGVTATDGEIHLHPGDVISIPTNVFRGFENVGAESGFLYAILGGDDPGRVLWAPQVFDMAKDYGLILLENGALFDTTAGVPMPSGIAAMPVTTAEQVAQLRVVSSEDLQDIVVQSDSFAWTNESLLSQFDGVWEAPLIGPASMNEGLIAARIDWPHQFVLRAIKLAPGAKIPAHQRSEEEVIFVQQGELTISIDEQALTLKAGDTFTTPVAASRQFHNQSDNLVVLYVTRRGDHPEPPLFLAN